MPRLPRTVSAHRPHHVTQRGNRREDVFFTDEDRLVYLEWLREYSNKFGVDVLAYCLMTNHVHLVVVPSTDDGLQRMLKPLHMRYAQHINRTRNWTGHLWQGRFFSSMLDDQYLWAAIRYVERNPVRAKMVTEAEAYDWSSARARCRLTTDRVLTSSAYWQQQFEQLETLRRNTGKGLPCGSLAFVRQLEALLGRTLRYRPQGRPKLEAEKG
jgi:putative transposase